MQFKTFLNFEREFSILTSIFYNLLVDNLRISCPPEAGDGSRLLHAAGLLRQRTKTRLSQVKNFYKIYIDT